jgi:hypothetical protein
MDTSLHPVWGERCDTKTRRFEPSGVFAELSYLADCSSDLTSATGPRWVSLSGLTIGLMLVIDPTAGAPDTLK